MVVVQSWTSEHEAGWECFLPLVGLCGSSSSNPSSRLCLARHNPLWWQSSAAASIFNLRCESVDTTVRQRLCSASRRERWPSNTSERFVPSLILNKNSEYILTIKILRFKVSCCEWFMFQVQWIESNEQTSLWYISFSLHLKKTIQDFYSSSLFYLFIFFSVTKHELWWVFGLGGDLLSICRLAFVRRQEDVDWMKDEPPTPVWPPSLTFNLSPEGFDISLTFSFAPLPHGTEKVWVCVSQRSILS